MMYQYAYKIISVCFNVTSTGCMQTYTQNTTTCFEIFWLTQIVVICIIAQYVIMFNRLPYNVLKFTEVYLMSSSTAVSFTETLINLVIHREIDALPHGTIFGLDRTYTKPLLH